MSRPLVIIVLTTLLASACATAPREAAVECDSYVADEVAVVFRAYDTYDRNGFAPGMVSSARSALEHARLALHNEQPLPDLPVCPRKHKRTANWRDLADDLEVADALVVELENARGVRFVGWSGNAAEWVDATTGKAVPKTYAASL